MSHFNERFRDGKIVLRDASQQWLHGYLPREHSDRIQEQIDETSSPERRLGSWIGRVYLSLFVVSDHTRKQQVLFQGNVDPRQLAEGRATTREIISRRRGITEEDISTVNNESTKPITFW